MKKILLFCFFLAGMSAFAQEDQLSVVSFDVSRQIYAQTNVKMVENTETGEMEPAAVIIVDIPTENQVTISDSYLNEIIKKEGNSYYLYMQPGAKKLKIAVLNIGTLNIKFSDITPEIGSLKPKMTYDLKIHVPQPDTIVELVEVKQTYEDLKKEARSMYGLRQSKNTTEFFLNAMKKYNAAMGHQDMPAYEAESLNKEFSEMKEMRQYTYAIEEYWRRAESLARTKYFEHDTVLYQLTAACALAQKLYGRYPFDGFRILLTKAKNKENSHPRSPNYVPQPKSSITDFSYSSSNSAYGKVTQRTVVIPYESINIYAVKTSKPKKDDRKQYVGRVKKDRTYNVELPDGYDYIIFDGEKEGHYVYTNNQEINVYIK